MVLLCASDLEGYCWAYLQPLSGAACLAQQDEHVAAVGGMCGQLHLRQGPKTRGNPFLLHLSRGIKLENTQLV